MSSDDARCSHLKLQILVLTVSVRNAGLGNTKGISEAHLVEELDRSSY